MNPLLDCDRLPAFDQITPDWVVPAIEAALADCRATVAQVVAEPTLDYQRLAELLEAVNDRLGRIWAPVSHLNAVCSTPELRQAHDACLPLLSEYYTWLGQHEGLYQRYQQLAASPTFGQLPAAEQQAVTIALRDFRLTGVALPPAAKQRYAEIAARLSELGAQFSNHLLDATQAWQWHTEDAAALPGLPPSALEAAAARAQAAGRSGYLFTLDLPAYLPVINYCRDRALRRTFYEAYATRASELGPNAGQFDNGPLMRELLALRHEQAQLLGFADYAELSLATKMAPSVAAVEQFLLDLAARAKPQAERELAELRAFASSQLGIDHVEAWDIGFAGEALREQRYALSQEQLRPYFPEPVVVAGLFSVAERLFGVRCEPRLDAVCPHPEARYYAIVDQDGGELGGFYLDLYARSGKRGGAWMADLHGRRRRADGSLQRPVAFLTCNFNRPVGEQPALFTHDEVLTLFHEFGHGLHHLLTEVEVGSVAGISNVAWDAVELPSQFLENWCWQQQALAFLSRHWQNAEPLPSQLLHSLLAARNFQSAMQMVRQLEFSLFDLRLHHGYASHGGDVYGVLNAVREQVAVVRPPAFNRFANAFGHIFAGGYAAGYYSYKWAEVLSADAFSRFEEEGIFSAEVGDDFRRTVLAQGASQPAMELFVAFRGREPQVDALLRHSGIAPQAA